jgi:hypothetical protein
MSFGYKILANPMGVENFLLPAIRCADQLFSFGLSRPAARASARRRAASGCARHGAGRCCASGTSPWQPCRRRRRYRGWRCAQHFAIGPVGHHDFEPQVLVFHGPSVTGRQRAARTYGSNGASLGGPNLSHGELSVDQSRTQADPDGADRFNL